MSVTALSMITRSMRLARVIGPDESALSPETSSEGLYALNAMMDAFSVERLMCYQIVQNNYSWAANATSKTIGSGGDFNTTRPTKIAAEGNFFRDGSTNIDYPLTVMQDRDDYDRILLKSSTSSYPQWLFPDMGFPLITLYVYPVPTQALTLYLNTWKALQSFSTLTTVLALPPGYQQMIEFNLAVTWAAPHHKKMAPPDVVKLAAIYKRNLKALNTPANVARLDPALMRRGTPYNIYTDGTSVAS